MANNFQRGDLCPVVFQPTTGSAVVLNVTGHDMEMMRALFDVTHTGHGGVGTARIAGKPDASGNCSMDYDADRTPYALNLIDGMSGYFLHYITPSRAIQQPAIIEKVTYKSAVAGKVEFGVSWKQNVNIGIPVYGTG